jgi:non-specific serine/threonine protein kinase
MTLELHITPHGRLSVAPVAESTGDGSRRGGEAKILQAFEQSTAHGLQHLATVELDSALPPELAFARELGRMYLTARCRRPEWNAGKPLEPLPAPADELAFWTLRAPPLRGSEYLTAETAAAWWRELDALVLAELEQHAGNPEAYLQKLNPAWRVVGRVTFHLAENKRDPERPFAFLATYVPRLSGRAKAQHLPLGKALEEYASARDRETLVALLSPVRRAADRCEWVRELVESHEIYQPLAWTPQEAYRFLESIPELEAAGLIVRVPDWWHAKKPPRPMVNVRLGSTPGGIQLGANELLEFSVGVALDGEPLSEEELETILASSGGLVSLKGRWVEVDRAKLGEALRHWRQVEREARDGGVTFFEGMRLLSGAVMPGDAAAKAATVAAEWTGIEAGEGLQAALDELHDPQTKDRAPPGLRAELRPYQQAGVHWLRFMTRLGLGACLADDMGLGKTIQVIGLLLHIRARRKPPAKADAPCLLVVPASLIGNWKGELAKFAPSLVVRIAHPSEGDESLLAAAATEEQVAAAIADCDLVITTYGMAARFTALRGRRWNVVILDEAQAIKNAAAGQTRVVKEFKASARLALTGTPIENRLGDLWSIFDFLNPGLLGGPKDFTQLTKRLSAKDGPGFGPLRTLVKPYILRRLKTDKAVIADLPEKTETNAYCGLTKRQAALYEAAVREMARELEDAEGIQRRGLVLSYLMRFKQICNHPSQLTGDGDYDPKQSAKFLRLGELCGELAERQQKALVFTQFRELTGPLAEYLTTVFGRAGLVLHGGTAVGKRRSLVEDFQRDDGPPFFVLSLKAGGTGLNLTEAAHVIHFDRWWNPAVENQATDRAFRIGQKRNVMVHKFVCRGTLEERIDELILQKKTLAGELLDDAGGEIKLTELDDRELLRFVSLDARKAIE